MQCCHTQEQKTHLRRSRNSFCPSFHLPTLPTRSSSIVLWDWSFLLSLRVYFKIPDFSCEGKNYRGGKKNCFQELQKTSHEKVFKDFYYFKNNSLGDVSARKFFLIFIQVDTNRAILSFIPSRHHAEMNIRV